RPAARSCRRPRWRWPTDRAGIRSARRTQRCRRDRGRRRRPRTGGRCLQRRRARGRERRRTWCRWEEQDAADAAATGEYRAILEGMADATFAPPRPRRAATNLSAVPYPPGLAGMRALAVVAVMVYHANPGWLSGGFLAV